MQLETSFITDIKGILRSARSKAYTAVNFAMVEAYWNVGKRIVEEEQKGEERAVYGTYLIKELSLKLRSELGKGFSEVNLRNFRRFYQLYPAASLESIQQTTSIGFKNIDNQIIEKQQTLSDELQNVENQNVEIRQTVSALLRRELTWSHYQLIIRVDNPKARGYYINEAADNNWSVRVLQRNINTLYYERILSSKNKEEALLQSAGMEKQSPADFIKDPYIFEFLNIEQPYTSSEYDIETALINNLQHFLLELGKGFSFVKRQFRINTETKSFAIDLVFYNYLLKCFVLFDLKTGELSHQDVGQMDMYVRMFDDLQRTETDNPTIGIILCTDKDETIVKYSVLNGNEKLFATKYKMYLPTEQELIAEIEREKLAIEEKLKSQNQK